MIDVKNGLTKKSSQLKISTLIDKIQKNGIITIKKMREM